MVALQMIAELTFSSYADKQEFHPAAVRTSAVQLLAALSDMALSWSMITAQPAGRCAASVCAKGTDPSRAACVLHCQTSLPPLQLMKRCHLP